jgi:copper(I)-binding protein
MKRGFALMVMLFAVATASLMAQKTLTASKAWIKAPAAGASTAAAFVVIDNPTMYDVYVVSAQSDAAASVTFLQPGEAKGAEPRAVEHLTAPAYDRLELTPDGFHMLLSGLKKPLKPGDKVTIVLATDSGIALEASAEVK